jgi:hypothetical protein
MSAARFESHPGCLQWHPAHGESACGDPETFHLHVEFAHAHGIPKGEFTTFSNTCTAPVPVSTPTIATERAPVRRHRQP